MKGSWKLGSVQGIGIFIHWTFLFLVGWVAVRHVAEGATTTAFLAGLLFIAAVFTCVVLHELGHALTARRFGIQTRDITLLPIGGVARLERMPERPVQELLVAIAGPAVNVGIAGILFVILVALGRAVDEPVALVGGHLLNKLMWVNVSLVLFNLVPAFPMDGGRILRAALATRLDYARATRIAATLGKVMAGLFALGGLFGSPPNPFLVFIALFVWLGAQAESEAAQMRSAFRGVPVRDAMITRFRTLSPDDVLLTAKDELLAGSQQDFPVLADGALVGVLARSDLVRGLADRGVTARVGEVMSRNCPVADAAEPLDRAYLRMREGPCATLPVVQDGQVVGMLTLENVGELMMVRAALAER